MATLSHLQKNAIVLSHIHDIVHSAPHLHQVIDVITEYFSPQNVDVQPCSHIEDAVNIILGNPLRTFVDITTLPDGVEGDDCLVNFDDEDTFKKILNLIPTFVFYRFLTYIIIHFPQVKVTNEHDRSIDITHLYALLTIGANGAFIRLDMNRSEFTLAQWKAHYCHSHLPRLDYDMLPRFDKPCFGTGPILDTTNRLQYEENYDLDQWGLFCFELEKYVANESLNGIPYVSLETVGKSGLSISSTLTYNTNNIPYALNSVLDKFLADYCHSVNIPIVYRDNQFMLGCSEIEFIISVSNFFIQWVNAKVANFQVSYDLDSLIRQDIIFKCIISNNKIYPCLNNSSSMFLDENEGKQLTLPNHAPFFFKGAPVKFHVIKGINESIAPSYLLNLRICSYLLTKILSIINQHYDPNDNTQTAAA